MYSEWLGILSIGIIFFLLMVLTYLIYRQNKFISELFPKQGGTFRDKLGEVLREFKSLKDYKRESFGYIQKVALKRYNPYKDTGGDQSFSVALLDGRGDGVVITSLHARATTRVFAKGVKSCKEDGILFSDEERTVIEDAFSKN